MNATMISIKTARKEYTIYHADRWDFDVRADSIDLYSFEPIDRLDRNIQGTDLLVTQIIPDSEPAGRIVAPAGSIEVEYNGLKYVQSGIDMFTPGQCLRYASERRYGFEMAI